MLSCTDGVSVPGGLPEHFALGLSNRPEDISWMRDSGTPWDYRYQYLTGDVTLSLDSGSRWTGWNTPTGQFATYYMERSAESGYIPVFTYYTMVSSSPDAWSEDPRNRMSTPGTMRRYFEDWKLLMVKAGEYGGTVIVHHEPDLWGFMQRRASRPESFYVAVDESGFSEAAGFANNAAGFAQALVSLRDRYAPNVTLAWHASHWANNTDFTLLDSRVSPEQAGSDVAGFYNALGADFDLVFADPSDRDWGYHLAARNQPQHVWNDATFDRFRRYVATLHNGAGLPVMLWQVPIGNTRYRTVNNTDGHYQDNQVEYFLDEDGRERIEEYVAAGAIGVLFGRGDSSQTTYLDDRGDGVTNPAAINGNDALAVHSDDDGGFLRLRGAAYYADGPVPLRGC